MKTIYIKTSAQREAIKRAERLYLILRDCTPVIADIHWLRAEVQTENVFVRYISKNYILDGIRCDIAIGFNPLQTEIMTGKRERYDLYDEKQIAKFIVEEESK